MSFRNMSSVIAALALAVAIPAAACDGHSKASASSASADGHSCSGMSRSTAWAGAWMQRSSGGQLTVVAVAEGSPAARSGLRAGDIVLAVNGKGVAEGHACAYGTACSVGSSFAYTVQRGKATKTVKVRLEKMPVDATTRFASQEASYEPTLAAMVIPVVD